MKRVNHKGELEFCIDLFDFKGRSPYETLNYLCSDSNLVISRSIELSLDWLGKNIEDEIVYSCAAMGKIPLASSPTVRDKLREHTNKSAIALATEILTKGIFTMEYGEYGES